MKVTSISNCDQGVNEGNAYVVSQRSDLNGLDTSAPLTYKIVVPNTTTTAHLVVIADLEDRGYYEIFKDDGVAAHFNVTGGTAVTPFNVNGNSNKTSTMTITSGVTVTQATTDVLKYVQTFSGSIGNSSDNVLKFTLKYNTSYLIRLSTYADNNEGSLVLFWTEEN